MTDPAIPTPEQIRQMPVTSVKALRNALKSAGLTVRAGGSHLRVELSDGTFIGIMPSTTDYPRSLLNCRSYLAKRVAELHTAQA